MSGPTFFRTPAAFRKWLARHHDTKTELIVGFHRKASGKGGITYPESLDEALCYGWIDGVRRRLDEDDYCIRFTPRRPKSYWSAVNIRHVARLERAGRMAAPGIAAFARRDTTPPKYSFENRPQALAPDQERAFKRARAAWSFFQAQPPGYRRTAVFFVTAAKQAATRHRRLRQLIDCSARGERLPQLLSAPPRRKRR